MRAGIARSCSGSRIPQNRTWSVGRWVRSAVALRRDSGAGLKHVAPSPRNEYGRRCATYRTDDQGDHHAALAAGRAASLARFVRGLSVCLWCRCRCWSSAVGEQTSGLRQALATDARCEESGHAKTAESLRQLMLQEALQELQGSQSRLPFRTGAVVPPVHGHRCAIVVGQARIRDRDPVRVATEISQCLLGRAERTLGIGDPALRPQSADECAPLIQGGGARGLAVCESAAAISPLQASNDQRAEAITQAADRHEEGSFAFAIASTVTPAAVLGQAAAGHDAVDVRMQSEIATPGMQDLDLTDLGAEMLGVLGQVGDRAPGTGHYQIIAEIRCCTSQVVELLRHGADDVKVHDRKKFLRPLAHPARPVATLAQWAMAIAAAVVDHVDMVAVGALPTVRAGCRRSAASQTAQQGVLRRCPDRLLAMFLNDPLHG